MNIAPPDPLKLLSGAFSPRVLKSATPGGLWSPRLAVYAARLLKKVMGHCAVLVQIIRNLELCFDLGQNRVLNLLEYKADLLQLLEDLYILREFCEHCLHVCEELFE